MGIMTSGSTALFKLDDTDNPGLARVKLLRENSQLSNVLPWKVWKAEVLEIVKPSTANMKSRVKVGKRMDVGEKNLLAE